MNIKEEKELLEIIFRAGISGASENIYRTIGRMLEEMPVEYKRMKVSLSSLKLVLDKLSNKWDKEIDKFI